MTNVEYLEELYEIRDRKIAKGLDTTKVDAKIAEVKAELLANRGN